MSRCVEVRYLPCWMQQFPAYVPWSPTQPFRELVEALGEHAPREVAELVAEATERCRQLNGKDRERFGDVPRANQSSTVVTEVAVTLHGHVYRPPIPGVASRYR